MGRTRKDWLYWLRIRSIMDGLIEPRNDEELQDAADETIKELEKKEASDEEGIR